MLTKPAGVFVQLIAAAVVIAGGLQFGTGGNPALGVILIIAAIGLFWLGRQTGTRQK